MSDQEWDADDFDPSAGQPKPEVGTDRWSGEDEDDIKDNWDDDEENNEAGATSEVKKKKKKSLKDIIAEKEEKKRKEMEERRRQEEEAKRKMTPEEMMEEKIRQQKIQEDSDLEIAKDALGVSNSTPAGVIDSFEPITKADFEQLSGLLKEKLSKSERSTHYVGFLETLFRELTLELDIDDIKKLSSSMNALYNEKNKAQKSLKGKKKGKAKMSLNPGKDDNFEDYTTGAMDDYDDFM